RPPRPGRAQARQIRHSCSRFVIPNLGAILESLTLGPPDGHTVAPITVPTEMRGVPTARGDIPVRSLPRKSAAVRMEPMCAKLRHVPVFVNGFQPAPDAHSV